MSEFDLIETYFLPLSMGQKSVAGFKNDAAVLNIPSGKELVISSDTLHENVHFLCTQTPETIAKKALRTNISDMAAMSAQPYCYQLCLGLPKKDELWLERFSASLLEDQKQYNLFLSGGDTTSTASGEITISITILGLVERGKSLTRSGAQGGDFIVLTGSIGDAYCGLKALRESHKDTPQGCIDRYYVPQPRHNLSEILCDYAHAAIDVSDGLLQDLGHIAQGSSLRAFVALDMIRWSDDVKNLLHQNFASIPELLNGGDDYELLMAVSPDRYEEFYARAQERGIALQNIGVFEKGTPGVDVLGDDGQKLEISAHGWQHF